MTATHTRGNKGPRRTQIASSSGRRPSSRRRAPAGRRSTAFLLLFAVLVVLNLIGLVMVLSASSVTALHEHGSSWYYFKRELLYMGAGSLALVAAMRFDYHHWSRLAVPVLALSIGLMVLVLVPGMGVTVNGSSRWLGFGVLQIQPSEFAKLGVLLFAADLLSRRARRLDDTRLTLRPVIAVFGITAFLLMLQPNLGTTLVLGAITFTVLFSSGVPLGPLAGWGFVGAAGALFASMAESYRRRRVLAFLDPWADRLNTGYQIIQSQVSLASGGLLGVGLGASRAKWGFLPYAHTDFIFAIIGEEIGIVGATLVVGLFGALAYLGVRTAVRAPDRFGQLLAVGITAWLCVQAFVNIGAVIGVLPITGVPLPFVSYGGSSLVATMAAAGILLNVCRQAR